MENIDIQVVEFNSPMQLKSVELRYKVLREPLGLVYTSEQLADEIDEAHIVALKQDEHSGIGKLLVFFAEQYAKNNGFHLIELHARDTAKDFYLKLNYKVEGNVFMEVGIPHYKMKKVLV